MYLDATELNLTGGFCQNPRNPSKSAIQQALLLFIPAFSLWLYFAMSVKKKIEINEKATKQEGVSWGGNKSLFGYLSQNNAPYILLESNRNL